MAVTFDYSKPKATAERLLAKFGQSATIVRAGGNTGSEYAPTVGADVEYLCTVVEFNLAKMMREGSLVEGTDAVYMVSTSGLTITIDVKDRFKLGSTEYAILKSEPFAPGGTILYYILQVKL